MYYCSKCGKQMAYDAPLCIDCAHAAQEERREGDFRHGAYEGAYTFEPISTDIFEEGAQGKSTRTAGLGRAIVGAVLAELSAVLMAVVAEMMLIDPVTALIVMLLALAPVVVGLVLGIVSIKTFREVRRAGKDTPIATLILGIYALSNTAFLLLIALILLAFLPLLL